MDGAGRGVKENSARGRAVKSYGSALLLAAAMFVGMGRAHAGTPDIPKTLPDAYLSLAFVNESGVQGLDWLRAALPAALGEKLEAHPSLRAAYGELVVPDGVPPALIDHSVVEAAAATAGAKFVFTGSFRRPNWKLELTLKLWQVEHGKATVVGEAKKLGDFSDCHDLLYDLASDLLGKAGRAVPADAAEKVKRAPTADFYAFTLYGRGLAALHGLGGTPDLAKAEKAISRSVFIDPKFAEAHRLLAIVYQRKGQPAKARGQLGYALDLRPDYYAPLALLVKSSFLARDRDEGVSLAEKALALRPWDLEVRYMLAEMLWEETDVDGAHLELGRIVAVNPDHLAARRILVLVHASKGNAAELAAELEKIIVLDPEDEPAKLDLAAAYHELGRDSDAITIYDAIVKRNPKHMQALKFLGDLYRSRWDLKSAIAYYEKALETNRNDPRPYFLLGAAHVEAGNAKEALRIYKQAQRFTRYLGETYSNLGAIYYGQGDNETALWYLGQAVKKRPSNPRVRYNFGLALAKAHKRDRALAEFILATELDPSEAEFRYALGVAYLRLGKIEEAEKAFAEAARLDPQHDDARHNLHLIDELRRRATEGEIQVE
jgi:Flp pilus assembly protein TadD